MPSEKRRPTAAELAILRVLWEAQRGAGRPVLRGSSKAQRGALSPAAQTGNEPLNKGGAERPVLRGSSKGQARSVRAIQQVLNQSRPTGYTTVLKLMQIMTEKGLVERDESQRPQLYRARYSEQQTQRQLLGDLVNRAFGGSVKAMVLQALATRKSTPEDLEAMEKLLDRFEAQRGAGRPVLRGPLEGGKK